MNAKGYTQKFNISNNSPLIYVNTGTPNCIEYSNPLLKAARQDRAEFVASPRKHHEPTGSNYCDRTAQCNDSCMNLRTIRLLRHCRKRLFLHSTAKFDTVSDVVFAV